MKLRDVIIGLLIGGALAGCARDDQKAESFTMRVGPYTAAGITYYPAHPGTTCYGTVDYTTNQPPTGTNAYVNLVTTNDHWSIKVIDGK